MGTLAAPDELKMQLIAVGSRVECPRGDTLFRRGDPATGIFLIEKGRVRLGLEGDPPGFPWRNLGPGSVVGLPATLSDSTYSLNAEVIEDSSFIFLARETLLELLRKQHHLCFQVMNILTEELAQTRASLDHLRKVRA